MEGAGLWLRYRRLPSTAAFAPRHANQPVQLRAHVHAHLAWSLRELPLGEDQRMSPTSHEEWEELEVSVADDEDSIRWIRAQGAEIRVIAPRRWRDRLAAEARSLLEVRQVNGTDVAGRYDTNCRSLLPALISG